MAWWKSGDSKKKGYTYFAIPCRNADDGCEKTTNILWDGEDKDELPVKMRCAYCEEWGTPSSRASSLHGVCLGGSGHKSDMAGFSSYFNPASIVHISAWPRKG